MPQASERSAREPGTVAESTVGVSGGWRMTLVLTATAMCAFAANSVLCRLALRETVMDPVSFTAIRLVSGALLLVVLVAARGRGGVRLPTGTWWGGFWLFAYAVGFSFAYVALSAGTGAVLLFGVVQITMVTAARMAGDRIRPRAVLGFVVAGCGVVYLLLPSVSRPALLPAVSMAVAGAAWGFYSLAARQHAGADPVRLTAGNFVRSLPFLLVAVLVAGGAGCTFSFPARGIGLAAASGALASALGYVLWYAAVPRLGTTRAAVVQLSAPILAALGGVLFAGEVLTSRLIIATTLVLGGVLVAVLGRVADQS